MSSDLARALWMIRTSGSVTELTRRYRRLCKLYHPDLHAQNQRLHYERHMQQINEAYTKALERFNIFTYKPPLHKRSGAQPVIHSELITDAPPSRRPPQSTNGQPGTAFASAEASRNLGRALAALQRVRTFFSLKGSNDEQEHQLLRQALKILTETHQRFPCLKEGQDALYYAGVAQLNLKRYDDALGSFIRYRDKYPDDNRSALFHFYAGLCHHRLENYNEAINEYGFFLLSKSQGQYKHFAALVANYMEAAKCNTIPAALPYG